MTIDLSCRGGILAFGSPFSRTFLYLIVVVAVADKHKGVLLVGFFVVKLSIVSRGKRWNFVIVHN